MSIPFDVIGSIVDLMAEYQYLSLFLSVLFTGESAIIVASMLVQETVFSFWPVFWLIFLAAMTADFFWFMLFRLIPVSKMPACFKHRSVTGQNSIFNNSIIGNNMFILILLSKFFYGARIACSAYVALSNMSTRRFMLYDSIGCIIYVYLFMLVGLEIKSFVSQLLPDLPMASILLIGFALFLLLLLVLNLFKHTLVRFHKSV